MPFKGTVPGEFLVWSLWNCTTCEWNRAYKAKGENGCCLLKGQYQESFWPGVYGIVLHAYGIVPTKQRKKMGVAF